MATPVQEAIDTAAKVAGSVAEGASKIVQKAGEIGGKVVNEIETRNTALNLMIGSVALHTVSRVSEKNEEYLSKEIDSWDPAWLTSRAHYFESGLVAFACFVHNCILAFIFGLSSLISLCKDPQINFTAKQLLLVSGMSGASIGISILGIVSPTLADRVYKNLADCLWDNKEGIHNFLGNAR
jgi:hypothetical protein